MSGDDIKGVLGALLTAAVFVGVTALTGGTASWALFAKTAAVTIGSGVVLRALAPRPEQGSADFAGVTRTSSASGVARWVVGRARIGGQLVRYYHDDADLYLAFALSNGSLEGLRRVWLGGEPYELGAGTPAPGGGLRYTLEDSRGREVAQLETKFSASGQDTAHLPGVFYAPSPYFVLPPGVTLPTTNTWGGGNFLAGISWIFVRLRQPEYGDDLDARHWQGIPGIEVEVDGIKIARPESDGAGGVRLGTPAWTDNAADIYAWYLMERRGVPVEDIDLTYYEAARAVCAQVIDYTALPGYDADTMPASGRRYTANGVIPSGVEPAQVQDQLDLAMAGFVTEFDGKYYLRPGAPRQARLAITAEDVLEEPVFKPGGEVRINAATAIVPQSREHDRQEVVVSVEDAALQARDGEVLAQNVGPLSFVDDPAAAHNLLVQALRRSRIGRTFQVVVKPGAAFEHTTLLPGDKVTLELPDYGISGDEYMVATNSVRGDFAVELLLTEWGAHWYEDAFVLEPIAPRLIPLPAPVQPPEGIAISTMAVVSQDGAVHWEVLASANESVHDLRVRATGANGDFVEARGRGQVSLHLEAAGHYTFEFRHISREGQLSAAATLEADIEQHYASPEFATPAVLEAQVYGGTLWLRLQDPGAPDLAGVEIRYTSTDIGSEVPLPALEVSTWLTAGLLGTEYVAPGAHGISVAATIPRTARYRFFIRAVNSQGRLGDIVEVGEFGVQVPASLTQGRTEFPEWPGAKRHLERVERGAWTGPGGRSVLFELLPAPGPASALTLDDWNGVNGLPFGAVEQTAGAAFGSDSTYYQTEAWAGIPTGQQVEVLVDLSILPLGPGPLVVEDDAVDVAVLDAAGTAHPLTRLGEASEFRFARATLTTTSVAVRVHIRRLRSYTIHHLATTIRFI